jgi:hypothetical protein
MAKVVRKDKLQAGYDGNLESVKVYDNAGTNQVATSNGVFVVVEGLLAGEREVKKARLAGATDSAKDVLFIHNSEVMYDERLYLLEEFVIDAGKVARAYRLYDGDIITLTSDLFSGTVAVGDQLLVKSNGLIGKPAVAGDLTSAKVIFTVIEDSGYELHQTTGAFAVQISRN